MKLMKILLVLVVLSVMMPMASAYETGVHSQSLVGTDAEGSQSNLPIFVGNTAITDTVSPEVGGYAMYFVWSDPYDGTSQAGITFLTGPEFIDVLPSSKTIYDGLWEVEVTEMGVAKASTSTKDFSIIGAPEFFLGPFIALLLVGILYAAMRRNLAGSFNVN